MINNFDMLFYTLAFIVPGFITNTIISLFVNQKNDQAPNSIIKFLSLSCINYAIWSGPIYLIFKTNYYQHHPYKIALIWAIIILVTPLVCGTIIGLSLKNDSIRNILCKVGLVTLHPALTSWDYKFSRINDYAWLIITLNDNSIVGGYFSTKSFVATSTNNMDIYIEQIYTISENNEWTMVDSSDGLYIPGTQIKYIEFLRT